MLFQLLKQKPDYFIIAWDSPKRTLRKEKFEDYKANRTKLPDEFKYQMWSIKELVETCKIPFLEMPGYEADDIIWTLVQQATDMEGVHFKIVSSDKDLKQLLSSSVSIFDGLKWEETNLERFRLEEGYEPALIVDYLSMVGDSADNIKWVPGIWAKWAEKLIKQFWGLDDIYAHIDEITWAIQTKLLDWKENAYASKDLIQLMEVPDVVWYSLWRLDFRPDFWLLESVLIQKWLFWWLHKPIKELKKEYEWWTQLWLFG